MRLAILITFALICVACEGRQTPPLPPEPEKTLTQTPQEAPKLVAPEIVMKTQAELLKFARAGSINGISNIANKNETFFSHEGDGSHRSYWVLNRRIGIDPNLKLRQLFEEPVGLRVVDGENWYIWPGLAALPPEELIPERLSFQDRNCLLYTSPSPRDRG